MISKSKIIPDTDEETKGKYAFGSKVPGKSTVSI